MTDPIAPLPSAAELAAATGKPLERAEAWLARLAGVQEHVTAHGRLPRGHEGKAELSLYDWIKYQRTKPAPEACQAILDARFPGWNAARRFTCRPFESRVQDLKVYRDAHGAWPSSRSRDGAIVSLSKWLDRHRIMVRSGSLAPYRKAMLDEQVPGWDETVQQTWERTAREIATFRERLGRMPSGSAAEHSERRLSRWIDDMRRGRGLSPQRRTFLDQVLPGWDITRQTSGLKQYAGSAAIQ